MLDLVEGPVHFASSNVPHYVVVMLQEHQRMASILEVVLHVRVFEQVCERLSTRLHLDDFHRG